MKEERIYISITEMFELFPILWKEGPKRGTIQLIGESGIGKTEAAIQSAERLGYPWVKINVPAEIPEPADLQGLGSIFDGKTIYMPPFWVVDVNNLAERTEAEFVILIVDEPGRAPLQIFQAMMPMALEYRVGSAVLHPKVRQVWIDNPTESDKYNVRTMDVAQEQRVQRFYLQYNEDAFFKHALNIKFHPEFYAFLRSHPEVLWNPEKETLGPISPRTAEFGSQACYGLENAKMDFQSGLAFKRLVARLGVEVTQMFITNLRAQREIIQPKAIIERTFKKAEFDKIMDAGHLDLCWLTFYRLAAELARRDPLKGQHLENVRQFLRDNANDELNYVFLKSMPDKVALNVLDAKLLERLKDRIADLGLT